MGLQSLGPPADKSTMSNAPDLEPGRYRATERFTLDSTFLPGFVIVYENEILTVESSWDGKAWVSFGDSTPDAYRLDSSHTGIVRISD